MEITKEIRSKLGLPITKDIIYVPHAYDDKDRIPVKVNSIDIIGEIGDPSFGNVYELKLMLENGKERHIHSKYLVNMQENNFLEKMNKDVSKIVNSEWYDW